MHFSASRPARLTPNFRQFSSALTSSDFPRSPFSVELDPDLSHFVLFSLLTCLLFHVAHCVVPARGPGFGFVRVRWSSSVSRSNSSVHCPSWLVCLVPLFSPSRTLTCMKHFVLSDRSEICTSSPAAVHLPHRAAPLTCPSPQTSISLIAPSTSSSVSFSPESADTRRLVASNARSHATLGWQTQLLSDAIRRQVG